MVMGPREVRRSWNTIYDVVFWLIGALQDVVVNLSVTTSISYGGQNLIQRWRKKEMEGRDKERGGGRKDDALGERGRGGGGRIINKNET